MTEVYNHLRFLSVKAFIRLSILSFSVFWELSSQYKQAPSEGRPALYLAFCLFWNWYAWNNVNHQLGYTRTTAILQRRYIKVKRLLFLCYGCISISTNTLSVSFVNDYSGSMSASALQAGNHSQNIYWLHEDLWQRRVHSLRRKHSPGREKGACFAWDILQVLDVPNVWCLWNLNGNSQ